MSRSSAAHLDTTAAAADPEKLAEDARDVATERAESLAAFAPRTPYVLPSTPDAYAAKMIASSRVMLGVLATLLPDGWTARAVMSGASTCADADGGTFPTWYVHADGTVGGAPHIACGTGRTFGESVDSLLTSIAVATAHDAAAEQVAS